MLNSLCFTPETCEVIHNCAGIIKSLCWYKTVEGEKQSRNTRDVWSLGRGKQREFSYCKFSFSSLPAPVPSSLAGRGAAQDWRKHLQMNNPVWEGRGAKPGLCCVSGDQWEPRCLQALLMSCRRTNLICCAALSLCPAGAAVFLLSFISSLQGACNELVKCSQYLKQGTLQPCLKCSLG